MIASISLQPTFVMQPQKATEWCWAANAASIAAYFGNPSWTQCAVADQAILKDSDRLAPAVGVPGNDCCSDCMTEYCNRAGFEDTALSIIGAFASWQQGALSMNDIVAQLGPAHSVPIVVRVSFPPNDSGHFVSITAADTASNTIHIEDPWYGASDQPIDAFTSAYEGSGSWSYTYFVKRPTAITSPPAGGAGAAPPAPTMIPTAVSPTTFSPYLISKIPDRASLQQQNLEELPVYIIDVPTLLATRLAGARNIGSVSFQQNAQSSALEFDSTGKAVSSRRGARVATTLSLKRAIEGQDNLRLLRVPALGITTLWSGAGSPSERLIPVDPAPPMLRIGAPYAVDDFVAAITPLIQRRAAAAGAEARHFESLKKARDAQDTPSVTENP